MTLTPGDARVPAVFELRTAARSMRFAHGEGVFAAASTFGGRWRVTDPAGEPLFSLAPAGAPGTDDREVLPCGRTAVATILRDRRQVDSWIVVDPSGATLLRADRRGPYEVVLSVASDDSTAEEVGRLFATTTAVIVEFDMAGTHPELALALPLYFATTKALLMEPLTSPSPDLALWAEPVAS